tara:strand:+ start:78232 stop:78834 length:603 start_codon:yes stop_codon:yes gene_type:complete
MGTDIHAFIETDTTGEFSTTGSIFSLTLDAFILDRDYDVFDTLAGAREHQMRDCDRDAGRLPLIPPRGIPSPRSLSVSRSFLYLVGDPVGASRPSNEAFWPRHRCVDPIEADKWRTTNPDCVSATVEQWFNGEHVWDAVSPLGLICPTWLTATEFDQSLNHRSIQLHDLPVSYRILRKSLEMLEGELGANCVRLVLWFDY